MVDTECRVPANPLVVPGVEDGKLERSLRVGGGVRQPLSQGEIA